VAESGGRAGAAGRWIRVLVDFLGQAQGLRPQVEQSSFLGLILRTINSLGFLQQQAPIVKPEARKRTQLPIIVPDNSLATEHQTVNYRYDRWPLARKSLQQR